MDHLYDPQMQCHFFVAPREIRDVIYAHLVPKDVHLVLRKNLPPSLVPCVQRDEDDDPDCRSRHRKAYPSVSDNSKSTYLRRLRSEWGPHWRCEEGAFLANARDNASGNSLAPLTVCKQMSCEFVDTLIDSVTYHINDIQTLSLVVLEDDFLSTVKKLIITLRLPKAVYKQLETDNGGVSSSSSPVSSFPYTWSQLPLAVNRMRRLERLRIWLDHDEPCSWSLVNERAVLSSLALLDGRGLDISINLPRLHPKWETPDRHFTADSAPFPLPVHRRYRQREHGELKIDGTIHCRYKPDFPEVWDIAGMLEEWGYGSTEEAEEKEWADWKAGRDPMAEFKKLFDVLVY